MKYKVRLIVLLLLTAVMSTIYVYAAELCYQDETLYCSETCSSTINNACTENQNASLLYGTYSGCDGNKDHSSGCSNFGSTFLSCNCIYQWFSPSRQTDWSDTCQFPTISRKVAQGAACP